MCCCWYGTSEAPGAGRFRERLCDAMGGLSTARIPEFLEEANHLRTEVMICGGLESITERSGKALKCLGRLNKGAC